MEKYRLRDKRKRNQEMYEYSKTHDLTFDEIGEHFNVSGSRAYAIIKGIQALKDKEKSKN